MERFGRGMIMSWRENKKKIRNKEKRRKSRTGFEKRRSGVPVLVFVAKQWIHRDVTSYPAGLSLIGCHNHGIRSHSICVFNWLK
ncbi:hypothetical protein J6590_077017 [Homalodisca vitripennis]|nr:hypothetical protein J6590_077017 [Homalodisca vitripennis]